MFNREIELVIVQTTPFCNLDCSYCYLPNRSKKGLISHNVIDSIFKKLFESPYCNNTISIVWHAGEPLIAPPEFYIKAFEICQKYQTPDRKVQHYIQTNGVLIDDAWCQFFKNYPFRIGISLDGPQALHDSRRKYRSGKGSHTEVMAGIKKLKDHGLSFSVIAVVTDQTLLNPNEFHDFFIDNDIFNVGLNIEEIENHNITSSLSIDKSSGLFYKFIKQLYKLANVSGLNFREFVLAKRIILNYAKHRQTPTISPLYPISFDINGNFTVFAPELLGATSPFYGDFTIGNITSAELEDVFNSPKFNFLNNEYAEGIHNCKTNCTYYCVCGGGSASNKFFENGRINTTETLFCRLTKKVIYTMVSDELLSEGVLN